MTVYEDFRCPACGAFEAKQHKAVDALVAAKTLRVDYHVVSFIDNGGGSGSKKSANAAACAMDTAGPAKFADYHEVLYQNQPQESDDAFGKDSTLLKLAGQVDGLRSKSFNSCVAKDSWGDWVGAVQKDFDGSGYSSTPTVLIDGKPLTDPVGITPAQFTKQVKDAAAQK
jgi:protein-disulfide isomerase